MKTDFDTQFSSLSLFKRCCVLLLHSIDNSLEEQEIALVNVSIGQMTLLMIQNARILWERGDRSLKLGIEGKKEVSLT